jgi:hypothetical protein
LTRRRSPAPPPGLRARWTIQRATVTGAVIGLAALLLSVLVGDWPGPILYCYALLLAATALCGASVLWITWQDVRRRGPGGRGDRLRPIRAFDLAAGGFLLAASLYALWLARPALGL